MTMITVNHGGGFWITLQKLIGLPIVQGQNSIPYRIFIANDPKWIIEPT